MADANQWRAVARAVLEALDQTAGTREDTIRLIDPAIAKFQAQAQVLRAIRGGATTEAATAGYVDLAPEGVSPTVLLGDARRDIQRRRSLHALARGVPLCARALRRVPDAATGQAWEGRNLDAVVFARAAQLSLCNATSFYMMARDAIDLASVLPFGAPLRVAWMEAAERLTNDAVREASMAHNCVVRMRQVVRLLSSITTDILGPAL